MLADTTLTVSSKSAKGKKNQWWDINSSPKITVIGKQVVEKYINNHDIICNIIRGLSCSHSFHWYIFQLFKDYLIQVQSNIWQAWGHSFPPINLHHTRVYISPMGPYLKLCEKVQLMLIFSFLTYCFFAFLNFVSILFQSVAWLNSQFLFYSILICVFHDLRTRWKIGGGCESNGLYLLQLAKENPIELSAINCQGGHYTMASKTSAYFLSKFKFVVSLHVLVAIKKFTIWDLLVR